MIVIVYFVTLMQWTRSTYEEFEFFLFVQIFLLLLTCYIQNDLLKFSNYAFECYFGSGKVNNLNILVVLKTIVWWFHFTKEVNENKQKKRAGITFCKHDLKRIDKTLMTHFVNMLAAQMLFSSFLCFLFRFLLYYYNSGSIVK